MHIKVKEGTGLFKIETAIPCGLILNEMLSNCFKYAFPGEATGRVDVFFGTVGKRGEAPLFKLEVKDNGVGIPADIEIGTSETLGFQLITMLSEQLNGKLEVDRVNGTAFSLTFTE
jgi:two-component sensor histidine kinase